MKPGDAALVLSHISKRYGLQTVLDDVSLQLRPGSVHALLGENGAGKTTLMHIAFGMVHADAGHIRVDGRDIRFRSPADAIRAGIGMVHQHFTLVPSMTVAENLALGGRGPLHRKAAERAVQRVAEVTGFSLDANAIVGSLTVGAQQRVEIAKALVRDARVLVMDEPTAVLAPSEADDLLGWLRTFVARGNAAVLITHKLREALAVADDVTVLRRGRVVQTLPAREASADSLTRAMIGTASPTQAAARAPDVGPLSRRTTFRAESITVRDLEGSTRLRSASFTLYSHEIIGIAGVEGSGQHELLRALAGRYAVTSGALERPRSVGFVPEDRHRDAVMLDRPLRENVALRGAGSRRGRIAWHDVQQRTVQLLRAFDVRAPNAGAPMRALSGGNQQKLVLAREMEEDDRETPLHHEPAAIVSENPTRGLDVLASAEVHARLRAARDRGATVVVYSSDLEEVLALADRVLVLFAGALREVPSERGAIGRAMLGLA